MDSNLIAQTVKALVCSNPTCSGHTLCITDKPFIWLESPVVFCSEKCLESDAAKMMAHLETRITK